MLEERADPEAKVPEGRFAELVGVINEVMTTRDGVSPSRVAEGVMTIMEVCTSVVDGAADGAVIVWIVGEGGGADDWGGFEAGGLEEGAGGLEEGGRLTGGGALEAGGLEGAAEGWLEGDGGLEDGEGAGEGTVEGVTDGKGGEGAGEVDKTRADVLAVALLDMLATIAPRDDVQVQGQAAARR